jgi:hypothetical protein
MITVPAADLMDPETLTKHLNARHVATDYAGLSALGGGLAAETNALARQAYHRYCHEFGEYDHEHREAERL